ncbi:MAG: cytochrome c biogenesis heme-transporting ATPase CcmA [Gammaproteobacteria bacterium]|nr:cytochrome c biogenesis heme-transporting ATPase CcmA [Gammaproteobacteria bacterium]MBQ0838995.1 cytochrome c biogenesis heme-transporting ATPase CcmA [Gammaproteobacteria bacterium]
MEFQALTFERDDWPLFSDLSGAIKAGEILQITGPNGCGKSTLLHILATIEPLNIGTLRWLGEDIAKCRQQYLADVAFIGHQAGLKSALSPRENLQWLSKLHPLSRCTSAAALARIGLAGFEDVPCYTLSAGQLRRAALATLCMTQARLWLLDEPLTALDVQGIADLEALLLAHVENGGAVVLSSHQPLANPAVRTLALDAMAEAAL